MLGKRQLSVTVDFNRCVAIRNALANEGIASFVRMNAMMNPGRMRGVPFINHSAANEYRIYVRRKDYDKAMSIRLP